MFILGEDLHPVPVGVEGELCIGGLGLARGYLNKPYTTAGSFIPNPFDNSGERIYRTGDLCRFLADGRVMISGRKDDQVKIRGFRIELQEIEAVIQDSPTVTSTLVVATQIGSATQLVAYVTPQLSSEEVEKIKARCAAQMPEYMVPSFILSLEKFPIAPSTGKIDRKALPQPTAELKEETYYPPTNETEEILAKIWCSLYASC